MPSIKRVGHIETVEGLKRKIVRSPMKEGWLQTAFGFELQHQFFSLQTAGQACEFLSLLCIFLCLFQNPWRYHVSFTFKHLPLCFLQREYTSLLSSNLLPPILCYRSLFSQSLIISLILGNWTIFLSVSFTGFSAL